MVEYPSVDLTVFQNNTNLPAEHLNPIRQAVENLKEVTDSLRSISGVIVSATAPDKPSINTLWYDSTDYTLKIWDGTKWAFVDTHTHDPPTLAEVYPLLKNMAQAGTNISLTYDDDARTVVIASSNTGGTVTGIDAGTGITVADNSTATPQVSVTNPFTSIDETKLDGIEAGAQENVQSDWTETDTSDDAYIKNKPDIPSNYLTGIDQGTGITVTDGDTVTPNVAVTNPFTQNDEDKLDGIEAGAEVNIQSDWNATAGASFIKNKPTIPQGSVTGIDAGTGITVTDDDTATPEVSVTNPFTTSDEAKLDGIESGAEVNVQADWNETSSASDAFIKNKPTLGTGSVTGIDAGTGITVSDNNTATPEVSVTNPFTDADETKLDGIAAGAEVNVQSDWDASSGDSFIKNKPTIPTVPSDTQIGSKAFKNPPSDLSNTEKQEVRTAIGAGTGSGGGGDSIAAGTGITVTGTDTKTIAVTNPFTDADETKLDGIASGAEVNVQSDWNQSTTTADDFIKNKPTIPAALTDAQIGDKAFSNPPNNLTDTEKTAARTAIGAGTGIDGINIRKDIYQTFSNYYIINIFDGGNKRVRYVFGNRFIFENAETTLISLLKTGVDIYVNAGSGNNFTARITDTSLSSDGGTVNFTKTASNGTIPTHDQLISIQVQDSNKTVTELVVNETVGSTGSNNEFVTEKAVRDAINAIVDEGDTVAAGTGITITGTDTKTIAVTNPFTDNDELGLDIGVAFDNHLLRRISFSRNFVSFSSATKGEALISTGNTNTFGTDRFLGFDIEDANSVNQLTTIETIRTNDLLFATFHHGGWLLGKVNGVDTPNNDTLFRNVWFTQIAESGLGTYDSGDTGAGLIHFSQHIENWTETELRDLLPTGTSKTDGTLVSTDKLLLNNFDDIEINELNEYHDEHHVGTFNLTGYTYVTSTPNTAGQVLWTGNSISIRVLTGLGDSLYAKLALGRRITLQAGSGNEKTGIISARSKAGNVIALAVSSTTTTGTLTNNHAATLVIPANIPARDEFNAVAFSGDYDDLTDTPTDSEIGDKAFSNPPSDLTTTEKTAVRTAIGAGTGSGGGSSPTYIGSASFSSSTGSYLTDTDIGNLVNNDFLLLIFNSTHSGRQVSISVIQQISVIGTSQSSGLLIPGNPNTGVNIYVWKEISNNRLGFAISSGSTTHTVKVWKYPLPVS